MPRLTLSFKESLYREILNGRDNDPANLHPARRPTRCGFGFFSPLNWAEITMAQLFLWMEILKNGELEDKARHSRRQEILPKNREEGCDVRGATRIPRRTGQKMLARRDGSLVKVY